MALAAYRHLLRATRIAFTGDQHLLHAAQTQVRAGFDNNSSLDPSSAEAVKAIEHAEGVASVLRHNIVQGVQAPGTDKFSTYAFRECRTSTDPSRSTNTQRHREGRQRHNQKPSRARKRKSWKWLRASGHCPQCLPHLSARAMLSSA